MFRLVRHFVEKPAFLLVCDNIECSQVCTAEASISELNPISLPQQEVAFLEEAKKSGWMISLRLQICPGHSKQLRELAEKNRANMMVTVE